MAKQKKTTEESLQRSKLIRGLRELKNLKDENTEDENTEINHKENTKEYIKAQISVLEIQAIDVKDSKLDSLIDDLKKYSDSK